MLPGHALRPGVKPAEQQQAFIVRQYLAIRGSQQNGAQFRRGLLDSRRAHSDGKIRQLRLRRDGVKVVFDRTKIRCVLAVAKDRFEFFLLHAALHRVLQT